MFLASIRGNSENIQRDLMRLGIVYSYLYTKANIIGKTETFKGVRVHEILYYYYR